MSSIKNDSKITNAQWEIMRVIWSKKETTSKEITLLLNQKYSWQPTTVKTLLRRLVEKKLVGTRKTGNKFIYFPLIQEHSSIRALSAQCLTKVCSQKVGHLIEMMITDSMLREKDIVHLQKVLQEKLQQAVEEVPCDCVSANCQCQQAYV